MSREPGQSQASADTLAEVLRCSAATMDARYELNLASRQLKKARDTLALAIATETAALAAYEATPWSEAS